MNSLLIPLLSDLGSSATEVANSLRKKGFKGRKHSGTSCPLANYLNGIGFVGAKVGSTTVDCNGPLTLPAACQVFVANHDFGCYPDLVAA